MAKTVCKILGVVLLLVGIAGFAKMTGDITGAHLNPAHNAVHIVSGVIALYFGFSGSGGAKAFCIIFGLVYLALGVCGFLLGHPGVSSLPGMAMGSDPKLWPVLRGTLELGQRDHIIHILLGIVFLVGGLMTKRES